MSKKIESVAYISTNGSGMYVATTDGKLLKYEERKDTAFDYSYVVTVVKALMGKVLTIVDASYTNEHQLKAIKDLIKDCFNTQLSDTWQISKPEWKEIVDESFKSLSKKDQETVLSAMAEPYKV